MSDAFKLKEAYWTEAIPYISKKFDGDGPYCNTQPLDRSNSDCYAGVKGMRFYCVINLRPKRCCAGIWINIGNKEKNKKIFDTIYSHKIEIESKVLGPIVWKRKDNNISSNIEIELIGADYTDRSQWQNIMDFHADTIKELNDYIVNMYKDEIEDI